MVIRGFDELPAERPKKVEDRIHSLPTSTARALAKARDSSSSSHFSAVPLQLYGFDKGIKDSVSIRRGLRRSLKTVGLDVKGD